MSSRFEDLNGTAAGDNLQAMVGRLNVILSERFNCRMLYKTCDQLREENAALFSQLHETFAQSEANRTVMGDEIILSVRHRNGTLAGFVIVMNGTRLAADKLEQALGLIDCTLVDMVVKVDDLEKLIGIERAFASSGVHHNVLPFRTNKVDWKNLNPKDDVYQFPRKVLQRRPILLRSEDSSMIQKIALEIHDQMGNVALVPFQDFGPEILNDLFAWRGLGPLTLFIEDVRTLTLHQVLQLQELTAMSTGPNCPQVIAGLREVGDSTGEEMVQLRDVFPFVFRCPSPATPAGMISDLVELFLYADKLVPSPHSPLTH